MKSRVVPALLVANGVLGACIVGVAIAHRAQAQESIRPADLRARGDYTMVSGRSNQGGPSLIYVIDSSNQEVVALKYEQGKQVVTGVGYRSIQSDARAARGR